MTAFRDRLHSWDLNLAYAFRELSATQRVLFDAWRERHPEGSDADWPGWIQILGPRPRLQIVSSRKLA